MKRLDWIEIGNVAALVAFVAGLMLLINGTSNVIAAVVSGDTASGTLTCAVAGGTTLQSPPMASVWNDGALWRMRDAQTGRDYAYLQRPGELCVVAPAGEGSR